jgi:hypothetical protein
MPRELDGRIQDLFSEADRAAPEAPDAPDLSPKATQGMRWGLLRSVLRDCRRGGSELREDSN